MAGCSEGSASRIRRGIFLEEAALKSSLIRARPWSAAKRAVSGSKLRDSKSSQSQFLST